MDDQSQNQTQNQQPQDQSQFVSQPVQPVIPPPQPPSAPPLVGLPKEQEPQPYIEQSLKEPEISEELVEAGVEKVSDLPKLSDEHKKIGIEPAKEIIQPLIQQNDTIVLPMTEEEAMRIIKTTKINDSRHWFAVLIEKIIKHLKLLHQKFATPLENAKDK